MNTELTDWVDQDPPLLDGSEPAPSEELEADADEVEHLRRLLSEKEQALREALSRLETAVEHGRLIGEARSAVRQAELDWTDAKATAAVKKKTYESRVAELLALVERLQEERDEQARLPFADSLPTAGQAGLDASASASASADAWRRSPIADLGLSAGVLAKLEQAGITTVGDLVDWGQAHPQTGFRDIAGIGPETEAKIADALADFQAQRVGDTDTDTDMPAPDSAASEAEDDNSDLDH